MKQILVVFILGIALSVALTACKEPPVVLPAGICVERDFDATRTAVAEEPADTAPDVTPFVLTEPSMPVVSDSAEQTGLVPAIPVKTTSVDAAIVIPVGPVSDTIKVVPVTVKVDSSAK